MHLTLTDRTVLVTGGGSGIGKGVASALLSAGARVMIVGRNADRLAATVDELASATGVAADTVRYQPTDVTNEEEASRAVDSAAAWGGRLHGVVHCAGGSETIGPVTQIDSEAWRRTVDLNVNGTMYLVKHGARELVRGGGGSFVGISSIASSNTHRWFGAYGPSKAAMDNLLMVAADELGPSWVRVNGIRPGLTRTDLVEPIMQTPAVRDDYAINTPLPRVGEVADIAGLCVFLLSDAGSWITGQIINVDGGQSLRRGPDFTGMLEPAFGEGGLRGVVD